MKQVSMTQLREALELSWGQDTAYLKVYRDGNPALGNCYPTSRIVQHFFPDMEVVQGKVWTGDKLEGHFWNVLVKDDIEYHIDLTWQQFPHGSIVKKYKLRDRQSYDDGEDTVVRIKTLLGRVNQQLGQYK